MKTKTKTMRSRATKAVPLLPMTTAAATPVSQSQNHHSTIRSSASVRIVEFTRDKISDSDNSSFEFSRRCTTSYFVFFLCDQRTLRGVLRRECRTGRQSFDSRSNGALDAVPGYSWYPHVWLLDRLNNDDNGGGLLTATVRGFVRGSWKCNEEFEDTVVLQ
ncbi:hypothetical protein CERZMDRAFT_105025 [Cercospora zeae-maydis SCOH1-5]|uniref:Uncharacterized protein n=1 Tax=Cercospora zeae-maydis SCOH1-5 TaxID=717836 RepID=A0A6A6FP24_9PEZI|nr:hypothetical protein CERZMDRAFT_105025 [Cercospora zeae-maydis SCOH1-5]